MLRVRHTSANNIAIIVELIPMSFNGKELDGKPSYYAERFKRQMAGKSTELERCRQNTRIIHKAHLRPE